MKSYDLEDLDKFGVHRIGGETCGLGIRYHYGLTEEAWTHWCHFTGLVQLIEHPRSFLAERYHATIVVPSQWMTDFLIYLVLQAGADRVFVLPEESYQGWATRYRVLAPDGEFDSAFSGAVNYNLGQYGRGYLVVPESTAEKEHGFRNRHGWTGEIE